MNVDLRAVNILSLCSGIAGLDLGFKRAVPSARTVVYCEREGFACEVLASRIEEGLLDSAPCWTNLRTFDGSAWRGRVDIVVTGIPCQPTSCAGKRKGPSDDRWLFPDLLRILSECGAPLLLLENVPGLITHDKGRTFRRIVADLGGIGYRVETPDGVPTIGLFSAEETGAPHRRERVFVLAYRNDDGCQGVGSRGLLNRLREALGDNSHRQSSEAVEHSGDINGRVLIGEGLQEQGHHGNREETPDQVGNTDEVLGDSDTRTGGGGKKFRPSSRRRPDANGHSQEVPLWPPLPDDREAWRAVLRERPDLEPALPRTEPALRGVVTKSPRKLDLNTTLNQWNAGDNQERGEEAGAEDHRGRGVLDVWSSEGPNTSQDKHRETPSGLGGSNPSRSSLYPVPCNSGPEGRNEGQEEVSCLSNLQLGILTRSFEAANLRLAGMFFRDWPEECQEAVDRARYDKDLCELLEPIYSQSGSRQDMQRLLLARDQAAECLQAMAMDDRIDRLRGLGNAVCPATAEVATRTLVGRLLAGLSDA